MINLFSFYFLFKMTFKLRLFLQMVVLVFFVFTLNANASTNVALNKPATASASYHPFETYGPHSAVDGLSSTIWSAPSQGTPQNPHWIMVDLEDVYSVERIYLEGPNHPAYDSTHYVDYILEYSIDNINWYHIQTGILWDDPTDFPGDTTDNVDDIYLDPNLEMRYVKVTIPSGHHWAHLNELQVYSSTQARGEIFGTVLMNGIGLQDVTVKLLDITGTTAGFDNQITDSNGEYSFVDVPAGDYKVMIVEPLGYHANENPIVTTLLPSGTNSVNFILNEGVTDISDTFDGTTIDECKWFIGSSGNGTVSQNNRAILSLDGDTATSNAIMKTKYEFLGDFDVQVEFEIGVGWSDPIAGYISGAVFGVLLGSSQYHMVRIRFPLGSPYPSNAAEDQLWFWKNIPPYEPARINSDATNGKYRLIRTGSTLYAKYDFGLGWQDLGSVIASDQPAILYLHNSSYNAFHTYTTYYDNFTVNSGTTTYSPCLSYGAINGMVSSNGVKLKNVTVKLLDINEDPLAEFDDQYTDENGDYSFADVPTGDYKVMIVEPLGYIVDQNPKQTTVLSSETSIVNFDLTEIVVVNAARSKGYWKHQFDVYVRGRGNAQETEQDLWDYIDLVHQHYTLHYDLYTTYTTFEDWQGVLSLKGNHPMVDRAKQHLAALIMNMVSGKVGQYTVVTEDGRDVGDVIQYCSDLIIDGDDTNDELAKDLAESVNNQQTIAAGIVPEGSILFKRGTELGEVLTYELYSNYPNPFNPSTVIKYKIPDAGLVILKVYDVLGNEVSLLINEQKQAGRYEVSFDASNLSSGVYIYKMSVNDFVSTRKMILMK